MIQTLLRQIQTFIQIFFRCPLFSQQEPQAEYDGELLIMKYDGVCIDIGKKW